LPGRTIARLAPAKINLALHVTGRRADGYHLLDSLVVFTRFGDRVEIAEAAADGFAVHGSFASEVPADASNLVLRARDRLRAFVEAAPERPHHHASHGPPPPLRRGGPRTAAGLDLDLPPFTGEGDRQRRWRGRTSPVAIRLTKNLPIASGVGGGSSDAAAALNVLASLWDIDPSTINTVAAELGADVPMCLAGHPLLARGIGHELTPLTSLPALPLVLVNPGVAISTPEVFRALMSRENPPLPPLPAERSFAALVEWLAATRNDLQTPAARIAPIIAEALAALRTSGAAFARMSGSGATCFGLFESMDQAEAAATAIRRTRPGWFVVSTASTASGETFDGQA